MDPEPMPWRTRMTYALTRARTIERQAEGLRLAMARLASREAGAASEVADSIGAIREQLRLAERLAEQLQRE